MGVVWLFHLLNRGNQVLFIIGKVLISFDMRTFHENPDCIIYTELPVRPRREKTCLWGLQQSEFETFLLS